MTLSSKQINRIKLDYKELVRIPNEFKIYLWEYVDYTNLELLIKRVLTYGSFEEVKKIYNMYPDETYRIAFKYPEIKRGVRFWIKRWRNFLS